MVTGLEGDDGDGDFRHAVRHPMRMTRRAIALTLLALLPGARGGAAAEKDPLLPPEARAPARTTSRPTTAPSAWRCTA